MKYSIYYSQLGGSNIIDLTNIVPEIKLIEEPNGLQIRTNVKNRNLFSPMFENPLNAKNASPSDSIHLVIPGLMPVLPETWKDFNENKIFYMPNDLKPHSASMLWAKPNKWPISWIKV